MHFRVENLFETDCFIKSALYCVKRLPEKVVSTKLSGKAMEQGLSRARKVLTNYSAMFSREAPVANATERIRAVITAEGIASVKSSVEGATEHMLSDEPIGKQEGVFPFLLGMLGSTIAVLKVG